MRPVLDSTEEDHMAEATKAPTDAAEEKEVLLVASKVRDAIRDHDCNVAGDAIEGLNEWVHWLIVQACKRAHANNRKTVRAHDFMALP
jgi:hypothetical protein